jgi:hypothetical protein
VGCTIDMIEPLMRIDFLPILIYMCAGRAHGFLPSKVLVLRVSPWQERSRFGPG